MQYEGWKVGSNIQNLRREKNLTAAKLSEMVGISESHQRQIEQGCHRISVDLLYKYVEVLEADADFILGIRDVSEEKKAVSIDTMLKKLSDNTRLYLESVFVQMIQTMPMQEVGFIEKKAKVR